MGLLVSTMFVWQKHVQLQPKAILTSKRPGSYWMNRVNCAFAVRAARRKAPKVQRNQNEWAIYFFISFFGREFSDLTELWPELEVHGLRTRNGGDTNDSSKASRRSKGKV